MAAKKSGSKRKAGGERRSAKHLANAASSPSFPSIHSQFADTIELSAEDPDFVTALGRGLAVMLALADKRGRMSIARVSQATGISRAAARRSLHTLKRLEFVAEDDTRRFYLRPRILCFSHSYLSASPIVALAQPILDRLGSALGKGFALAVLDERDIVFLAHSSSYGVLHPSLNVTRQLPAFCCSMGRILLAQLSESELADYLATTKFFAYTNRTIADPREIRRVVEDAQRTGFAYASEQIEPGICALAVPVFDCRGRCVAALNVVTNRPLLSSNKMAERFYKPLQQAALELSALLPD